MRHSWRTLRIGDLGRVITGSTPDGEDAGRFEGTFPFVTPTDLELDRRTPEISRFVSTESAVKLSKRIIPPGSVCFTCIGATIGKMCLTNSTALTNQQINTVIVDAEQFDPTFVYYRLVLDRDKIKARAGGAATPIISKSIFESITVAIPPLATQRKIAAVLAAYDDLIENNNRRIKLLEEIAQRIYCEWFIDLRYPGHQNVPLVDSERGQIPGGWISGLLREVVYFHIGGGWGAAEISSSHDLLARVVRGTDIPRIRWGDVSSCPARYHTAANLRSRLLHEGDIVFEVSGGSKGQPVGRSALISGTLLNELGMDAICASFCKAVRSNRDILLPELLNYRFLDAYGSGEIDSYQVQSTGITNLRFSQLLESFPVLIPSMAIQSLFVECVGPIMSAVDLLGIQVRNLRAARDLLIRRVVSGEIDLTDLNIAIPEAAA